MSDTPPRETSFSDLAADAKNLWFVDVSNLWHTLPGDRQVKNIRKILVHHHAGFPHDFTVKHASKRAASGEKAPAKYVDLSTDQGAEGYYKRGYGYHFDVPFVAEDSPDGSKSIIYVVNTADKDASHTGAGQNETGVGISLVGTMRASEEFPMRRDGFPESKVPAEYNAAPGLPSENQRRLLPVLVRFLQEKYGIADCHVQAHFQHGKTTCPGYDTEQWVIDHQDKPRREGKGFCYPVALTAGGTSPPFLQKPDQELARSQDYLRNTVKGRSGYYPFGRRHFWHNGVHLFPAGGTGSPVYAVRDGWVSAARFEKKVVVDGFDYGSAAFVVVHHEDPGVWKQGIAHDSINMKHFVNGSWQPVSVTVPVHPTYFSLSMHLKPLSDDIPWVKRLKEKDVAAYDKAQTDRSKTVTFDDVALPVKTGEIIGYVGTHDPFAALPKSQLKVAAPDVFDAKNQAVLHFEMFSGYNLVERLDPDAKAAKAWTIVDADANALAEVAADKLGNVTGLSAFAKALADHTETMETKDPTYQDPSLWSTFLDEPLLNALSCVIVNHVSEWSADWKAVLNSWYREWGLAKGKEKDDKKRIEKTVDHHLNVIQAFQTGWKMPSFAWRQPAIATYPFFYHPIRLLNWLNGMTRTPDVAGLRYNTMTGITAFDLSPRTLKVAKAAEEGDTTLYIGPHTGTPAISDDAQFTGTHITFRPDAQVYVITAAQKTKGGYTLTIDPPLKKRVTPKTDMRFGGYGWHWAATFAWDTQVIGA
jgi:hypothetical protein